MADVFQMCGEHLALIRNLGIEWYGDTTWGNPGIDMKRPYGDGDVEASICNALGWNMEGDDGDGPCWSSKQRKAAEALNREMVDAVQVFLLHAKLGCGNYVKECQYDRLSWKPKA